MKAVSGIMTSLSESGTIIWLVILLAIIFVFGAIYIYIKSKERKKIERLKALINNLPNLKVGEIIDIKDNNYKHIRGVFVVCNKSKNKYLVGKSVDIIKSVTNVLTGKGNMKAYLDYKDGDEFAINLLELKNSGYCNINELERDIITAYNAYKYGYNVYKGCK